MAFLGCLTADHRLTAGTKAAGELLSDPKTDRGLRPRKGLRVGSARTGEVWYFVPEHVSRQPSGMGGYGSMGEGVTADAAGNVYAGEVGPVQGLTKYIPRLKR